jgi:hypothetical protein
VDVGLATEFGREASEFSFQGIRLGTTHKGGEGVLVMWQNHLVAVLGRVDLEDYEGEEGEWFLEVGFGRLHGCHRLFNSIEEATSWIGGHYEGSAEVTALSKGV